MFGSRKTLGAVSMPAIAPSMAASPQPRPSIQDTRTPTRRASDGFDGGGTQREADLRELEEGPEHDDGSETDGDRADVRTRDRDPADVDRAGRERARNRADLTRPDPGHQAVEQQQQADRDDHDADLRPSLDRPDHGLVDADAADERHEQGHANAGQYEKPWFVVSVHAM